MSVTMKVIVVPPALDNAALLHQAAKAKPLSGLHVLFGDFARRVEKHDRVAQRIEHEAGGKAQNGKAAEDHATGAFACGSSPMLVSNSASKLSRRIKPDMRAIGIN